MPERLVDFRHFFSEHRRVSPSYLLLPRCLVLNRLRNNLRNRYKTCSL